MVRADSASLRSPRLPFKSPLDARADASKKSNSKPISQFKLGFSVQNCGDLPMQTRVSAGLHPQILRNSQTECSVLMCLYLLPGGTGAVSANDLLPGLSVPVADFFHVPGKAAIQ
jgi:hypothetical protein